MAEHSLGRVQACLAVLQRHADAAAAASEAVNSWSRAKALLTRRKRRVLLKLLAVAAFKDRCAHR